MIARTAAKMRAHLDDFSRNLSAGLCKSARRFVGEALYGIAARQSVRLTEIGRALEETIPLIKTETRLSRNLGRPDLREHLGQAILREGRRKVGERTLLVLDISDIPYIFTYGQTEAYSVHFKNKGLRSLHKIALFVENAVVGELNLMIGRH